MAFKQLVRSARALVVLVAAFSIMFSSCSKKKEQAKQEEQSNPNVTIENYARIPDITFKRLDGATERLSYYRDKIVLLNLWATWNKDCVNEIQVLNEIQTEYQRAGFMVLGVSIDKDGEAALRRFTAVTRISYPVFYGGEKTLQRLGGARKLPVTFLLLRDGTVYEKVVGFQDKKFLEDKIKEILSQRL